MKSKLVKYALLVTFTVGFGTGCASLGGNLVSDAALSGDPVEMWNDGKKAVKNGEELVLKGQKRVDGGRKMIKESQPKVDDATDEVLQARRDYQEAVNNTGGSTTPKQVAKESATLKKIGARWEDALAEIRKHNKRIDKGNDNVDKGQSEIRKGRKMIETGSLMMRNSQRLRLGDEILSEIEYEDS